MLQFIKIPFPRCRPSARRSRMRDLISSAVRSALSNQRSYNLVQSSIGFHISVKLSDFSKGAIYILNIFSFGNVPTKKTNNILNISSLEDEADRFNNQVMGFQLDRCRKYEFSHRWVPPLRQPLAPRWRRRNERDRWNGDTFCNLI